MSAAGPAAVIVLAAGEGTRMKSPHTENAAPGLRADDARALPRGRGRGSGPSG